MKIPALLKLAPPIPTPPCALVLRGPGGPKELDMSRDPYRDETAHVVERAQRQLEHEVGACRSSAFVLTLEGLPDQAASYLARAANFEVQLRQLGWPRRCLHSHRTAHADCSTGMVPSATFVEPPLTTALQRDIQSFSKRTVCLPGRDRKSVV